MSATLVCNGDVTVGQGGEPLCSTGWEVAVYTAPFDISQIDPVVAATLVGSGFFILLPLWGAVVGGRALISSIR